MIAEGKTVYVHSSNMFLGSESDNLAEYIITKVNTVSFYARSKESGVEKRFERKTKESRSVGYIYKAYIDPEEYHQKVNREDKEKEMQSYISKHIQYLNLEDLKDVKELINKRKKF